MAKIEQVFPDGFEKEAGLFRPVIVDGVLYHTPAWIYWRHPAPKSRNYKGKWLLKPSPVHFPGFGQREFSISQGMEQAFQRACQARDSLFPLREEGELIFRLNEKSIKSLALQAPGIVAMWLHTPVHYLRASAGNHMEYFPFTGEIGGPSYEQAFALAKEARERLKEAAKADARLRNLEQIKLLLGQA